MRSQPSRDVRTGVCSLSGETLTIRTAAVHATVPARPARCAPRDQRHNLDRHAKAAYASAGRAGWQEHGVLPGVGDMEFVTAQHVCQCAVSRARNAITVQYDVSSSTRQVQDAERPYAARAPGLTWSPVRGTPGQSCPVYS